ncbi:hypothetical protein C1646_673093 [Rhizophagus diaphanus]|nr:hypothetical protein C1646_673093 [Rhizophagus diaphanus] [Rhizophagus sp. MUCL 43196]
MSLYDLLYWSNEVFFAKGTKVLMYNGTHQNVEKLNVRMGYDDNPRTIQSTTKNYIWDIPIKDFLAASDEVQRNCLMPKPNQVIFKSKILAIWAASWLVDA